MGRTRTMLPLAAAMLAAAVLGACAQQPPTSNPAEKPSQPAKPSRPTSEPVPFDELSLSLEPVASGFTRPLLVTNAGDGSGRLFVVEQLGRVRLVRDGRVANKAFLDLTRVVSDGGERGLLGLAFAPDYAQSGHFYVNYTDLQGDTVVARYTAEDPASDSPAVGDPEVVLKVDQPYANHNGGCIVFAPDGTLLVGMGDGGSGGDPEDRAQDDSDLLGKMLSLDVTRTGRPKPKVLAKGLRNPWRFSIDPETNDVWIGDVGQNAWEEIDRVAWDELDGSNFGWSLWEGNHEFRPGAKRTGFVFPVIEHDRKEAQSITGGHVYRGPAYPALRGIYVYGDFVAGWIGIAKAGADGKMQHRIPLPDAAVLPSSFGLDESGELYVCDYQSGGVYRITAGR